MLDKTKNIVVTIAFILVLVLFFIVNLCKEDTLISITERRKLAKFPKVNIETLLNGNFRSEFEKYTTDQIIQRENFRKLKAVIELNLFNKKDNNNIYLYKNTLVKIEYPLNEKSVLNAVNNMNNIKSNYLNGMKCYYSIVPDKNYFTNKEKYIAMDYENMQEIMRQNLNDMEYINIFNDLQLEDYYITDIHWKQENLQKVVDTISTKMNFKNRMNMQYTNKYITEFDGIYSGQLPVKTAKDKICILTNEIIENSIVYNYETEKQTKIYDIKKLESNDKYDIYLSGSTPLITITNPNAIGDNELIVFRDSFASSLVPLFTQAYSKITLVDVRYMRSSDIGKYIEFNNQDILFLYSTILLNNSAVLR